MGWWLDWRVAPVTLLLICFGLIIMAIVGPLKIADQINKTLEEEFLFTSEGQPGWNRFVNNTQTDSAASYLKLWIVNTTNWQEAQNGSRPQLQEVGPYVFRQYIVNANPQFNYLMANYTFTPYSDGLSERVITFVPWIYFIWDAENPLNANLSLNDVFTVPNFGVWALWNSPAVQANPNKGVLLSLIVNGNPPALQPSTAFQNRTANELLFGYQDPLLTFLNQVGLAPTTRFQFIRNQTDVADAQSQVATTTLSCGFPNTVRFQEFILWQNRSNITYWDGGLVPQGTPGSYFGFKDRGTYQPQKLFWAQLARYLGLHSSGENTIKGVKTWHYVFDESEVLNSTANPINAKYYQLGPSGLFNSTSVQGAALFYSWPHYYLGDPELSSWYDGLPAASQANDESFVEIQQITGLAVKGKRIIQGNIPVGGLTTNTTGWNYAMPDVHIWPTYVMSLESEFTDAQADQMRDALDFYDRAMTGQRALVIGGALGAAISFCGSIYLFYKRREQWLRGNTVGLLQEEQHTEDVPIGYVETQETPGSPSYGARS